MLSKEEMLKESLEQFNALREKLSYENLNKECYEGSSSGGWHSEWSLVRGLTKEEIERECNEALALCKMVYKEEPSKITIRDEKSYYVFDCIWMHDEYYFALYCSYTYNYGEDGYAYDEIGVSWGVD